MVILHEVRTYIRFYCQILTVFPHIKAQALISYNPLVNQLLPLKLAIAVFDKLQVPVVVVPLVKLSYFIHSLSHVLR